MLCLWVVEHNSNTTTPTECLLCKTKKTRAGPCALGCVTLLTFIVAAFLSLPGHWLAHRKCDWQLAYNVVIFRALPAVVRTALSAHFNFAREEVRSLLSKVFWELWRRSSEIGISGTEQSNGGWGVDQQKGTSPETAPIARFPMTSGTSRADTTKPFEYLSGKTE